MGAGLRRKLLRATLVAGAVCGVALAAVLGTNAWVAHATSGRAYASTGEVPPRTVAIVPGSRVADGKPSAHLRARLQTALMLYQGGRVKKILVSGKDTGDSSEATVMNLWLRDHGVAPEDILIDHEGDRTRDTMNRAADIFDVTDAVICTQDVNAARSVYLAEQAGIDAIAVGLPTNLWTSPRYMRAESLKTMLAFFESFARDTPSGPAPERTRRATLASK
jgi:vancomycin permeability regulator SanA